MNYPLRKRYERILKNALRTAGLPVDPKLIIGRPYQFECEHGSHFHILCGTIQAIYVSDEGNLELHVSNPRFWGERLVSFVFNDDEWSAYIEVGAPQGPDNVFQRKEFFPGEFIFLDAKNA